MSKKHNPNNQISITDLMGDAVENAIARREQNLTTEETKQVKGGFVTSGGITIIKPPTTCGMWCPPDEPIKEIQF